MIKFGTDGWRAIIGDQFTFENVAKVIQAYADLLLSQSPPPSSPILLGYDRRFGSQDFAKTVASILAANGFNVHMGQSYCPTPCISWMTKTQKATGGVMVTASHNPYQWNGIKFKETYGGSASPEFTAKVEKQIQDNDKNKRTPKRDSFDEAVAKGQVSFFDPHEDYVRQLQSLIDLETIRKANWKIAYDPLFGAGAGFLGQVLNQEIVEIHQEDNPKFGGLNPEPIEKNLTELISMIQKGHFDVGLATDGDADRIGAVDENGNFVNPHQIFSLLLLRLIEKGLRGDVVKTVSTTQMLDRIAERHGLTIHETPVGFKHICAKFLETDPLIGGEESGGIGIPSHVYERDGLLCALLLLEIMSTRKKRLGELLQEISQEYGPLFYLREDLHILPDQMDRIRDELPTLNATSIADQNVSSVNPMDGVKFIMADQSWLLFRLSGTEPLVRVYAESDNRDKTQKLIQAGKGLLKL